MSRFRRKAMKFLYGRVLHADDTPHRIALGAAVGTFVGFSPTMGFQTVIALAVSAILRANKAICVPLVWITNPLTFVPIYWFCWRVGASVLPTGEGADGSAVLARMTSAANSVTLTRMLEWSFWAKAAEFVVGLGAELWVGCAIVGVLGAAVAYGLTLWGVVAYRRRRGERIIRRSEHRARRFVRARRPNRGLRIRESA